MALLGIIADIGSVVGSVAGAAGGKIDAGRKRGADELFAKASNGDAAAYAYLKCLSGDQSARPEAIRLGYLTADEIARGAPCGYATDAAKKYAQDLVRQLDAKRVVATTAGNVASAATQVGVDADPRTYLSTVSNNVGSALGFPSWILWAGAAAVLVYFVRKR